MERYDFGPIFDRMLSDAAAIVSNQQVLAGIHSELDRNRLNPFEQDMIYAKHYGQLPSEPKVFECRGVRIVSRVLHQTGRGLSDVRGADLLYEIVDDKFVLIQYKVARDGYLRDDPEQLSALLRNCPDVCPNNRQRPLPIDELPRKTFGFCGFWYGVMSCESSTYALACEAEAAFQHQMQRPLDFLRKISVSRDVFLDLFASCRIGALVRFPEQMRARQDHITQLLEDEHIVLEVLQRGKWSAD